MTLHYTDQYCAKKKEKGKDGKGWGSQLSREGGEAFHHTSLCFTLPGFLQAKHRSRL